MAEQFISSLHIEKLGHNLLEIRERALFNIISKLETGIVFDNDLARSKEILSQLFKWFLFEPCTNEETVFILLKRILQSESGKVLISHHGKKSIVDELHKIRSFIEPQFYPHIDQLLQLIDKQTGVNIPRLEPDIPLSYRTNESRGSKVNSPTVGTTATPIEGFIQTDTSVEQQSKATYRLENLDNQQGEGYLPSSLLQWQPLIETDRHVLQSVENSLLNPPQPSTLLHSCEFFNNVLLHDFPAEIFLQRPTIILEFFTSLEKTTSTRIANAVLNSLWNLTKALQIRINHYNDPCMCHSKYEFLQQINSALSTPSSENKRSIFEETFSNISEKFETPENVAMLKSNQITLQRFCCKTVHCVFKYLLEKHKMFLEQRQINNQIGVNTTLKLLEETMTLLFCIIKKDIWERKQTVSSLEILRYLNEILVMFGDGLQYFKLEASASDKDSNNRVIYLCLLYNCVALLKNLVPKDKTKLVVPKNLKNVLCESLLDVALGRLYPELHDDTRDYVESFCADGGVDLLQKYKSVKKICNGLTATVKFLRHYKTLLATECVNLAKTALPSLEFHQNLSFITAFVDVCTTKLPQMADYEQIRNIVEDVTVRLLAHNVPEIQQEMYKACHRTVVLAVGPKLNVSECAVAGAEIMFLLSSKIIAEIAVYGASSSNPQIKKHAEDILVHILKSQILVSETIWNKVVETLISTLAIIGCHAGKTTTLGRSIINILDPDVAKTMQLPEITILKCNIQFLFGNDSLLREEAFSRICWLLASQKNSRELLPRLNSLYDKALANIVFQKTILDVNKFRHTQHFYQPSNLSQVLDVLQSSNIEPVIRRSALTQISVMLEDPLLHQIFLDVNGIELVLTVLKNALTEKDFRDYPDSAIPVITILKNLCMYHSSVREILATNIEVCYWILRGLFMFFTEDRIKQDASTLLFLLIFKDYVIGSPSQADLSLLDFICNKIHIPFDCCSHGKQSLYAGQNLKSLLIKDRWSLSSIQVQWNCELFGGFHELLKFDEIKYATNTITTPDLLEITNYDLQSLKRSSVDFCVKQYLNYVQNGTSHEVVMESIDKLTLYVYLYNLKHSREKCEDFLEYPWELSFGRFLKTLPSSDDDLVLLRKILAFLTLIMPFYKTTDKYCWIATMMKDSNHCLLDLLDMDNTSEEAMKIFGQDLLSLITVCVCQEQHILDYYTMRVASNTTWSHVIKVIADNLKFNEAQHFYNLAYLDALLVCLVHLTASLGWSTTKTGTVAKDPIPQMISGLIELVEAFHCGKGPSAAVSVMGLSITRHVLLILNHLVAELQNSKAKNWEVYFFDEDQQGKIFKSFLALWASRDVVLRAAALQLFAGLAVSPKAALEIVRGVKTDAGGIYELALVVLIDSTEASIVRENCALLLANLVSHNTNAVLITSRFPNSARKNETMELLNLLDKYDFYYQLEVIINSLFIINVHAVQSGGKLRKYHSEKSWSSSGTTDYADGITTPGLVKAVSMFLCNILPFASQEISSKLQERGLVKLIFRTLTNPAMTIDNTKEMSLYCDVLEMNTMVCVFLTKVASCNLMCLGTVLHTRDCFNTLLSLLNPVLYHLHLPPLVYLRNKCWSEMFYLIATLLDFRDEKIVYKSIEALTVLSDALAESRSEGFLETMCESISCIGSHDLQNAALSSLTNILKVESCRVIDKPENSISHGASVQNLLDSIHTSRTVLPVDKSLKRVDNKKSQNTLNLLSKAYFQKFVSDKDDDDDDDDDESILSFPQDTDKTSVAGAELCKILLCLYDACDLKLTDETFTKNKSVIVSALTSILAVSHEAKKFALRNGLLPIIIKQLKEFHIKLSLDSVDCLRRVSDKKRVYPVLKDLTDVVGLLMNFMLNDDEVKIQAAALNLADIVHKLWIWFLVQNAYLVDILQMLCTFTTNCGAACQSLPLTSAVAGSGPRKSPSNLSLLHAIISIISKEMEQISKTHDLTALRVSFSILTNCSAYLECRIILSKTNLLQSSLRLHPAITKKQKPWDVVENIWLDFLQNFTTYPEGQTAVAKIPDVFELIVSLTNSAHRFNALLVLRNLAFYQPNRPRLLSSADFLNVLQSKLVNGNGDEKNTAVVIMWALAANSQKAKNVLKSALLDEKLQEAIKHYQLCEPREKLDDEVLQRMFYVLSILRDSDKDR